MEQTSLGLIIAVAGLLLWIITLTFKVYGFEQRIKNLTRFVNYHQNLLPPGIYAGSGKLATVRDIEDAIATYDKAVASSLRGGK